MSAEAAIRWCWASLTLAGISCWVVAPGQTIGIQPAPAENPRMAARLAQQAEWVIPYGQEFWDRSPSESRTFGNGNPRVSAPPFDPGRVIERVSHAFREDPITKLPTARGRAYVARRDRGRLHFWPTQDHTEGRNDDGQQRHDTRPAPFCIDTDSITRGAQVLYRPESQTSEPWVRGDTVQSALAPDHSVVEHFQARADGVALTWILRRAPSGEGPALIDAQISGATVVGHTEHGWLFAPGADQPRIRLGGVTAVDRHGNRWPLTARVEGDRFRIPIPESVLAEAAYPLAIDPLISPEFGTDAPIAIPGGGPVEVGNNGSVFLLVWQERRQDGQGILFGARVSLQGELLDPFGFVITKHPRMSGLPLVSSVGTDFLVCWLDEPPKLVLGVRIDGNGAILDPQPLVIGGGFAPELTSNGTHYLVTWVTPYPLGSPMRIAGAFLTQAGMVSPLPSLLVEAGPIYTQALTSVGQSFFLAWTEATPDYEEIRTFATRISPDGERLDRTPIAFLKLNKASKIRDLAFNGSNCLAVWSEYARGQTVVYAARINPDGQFIDPEGFAVGATSEFSFFLRTERAGSDFIIGFGDSRTVSAQAIGESGKSLLFFSRLGIHLYLSISGLADSFLLVHSGTAQLFDASLRPVWPESLNVRVAANYQQSAAMAFNGENYLLVWEDGRGLPSLTSEEAVRTFYGDLFGTRVSPAGEVHDPEGILICSATGRQTAPEVVSDGTDFLVAWEDYRAYASGGVDVFANWVSADGQVLNPAGLPVAAGPGDQEHPAIASNGQGYLMAWRDSVKTGDVLSSIRAARISADGSVLDSEGFAVSAGKGNRWNPAMASDGTDYLVVWQDGRNDDHDVFAARVRADGQVLDPTGLVVNTEPANQVLPAVAHNGERYLVVWQDSRPSHDNLVLSDIYGARLDAQGHVLDPAAFPISTAPDLQLYPSVSSDGNYFLVGWQDRRNFPSTWWDVYAARVLANGVVFDPGGVAIFNGPLDKGSPRVVGGANGLFLIVADTARMGTTRISGRRFSLRRDDFTVDSIARNPRGTTLQWAADPGEVYRVWTTTNLANAEWQVLSGRLTARGASLDWTDDSPPDQTVQFYKLEAVP